MTDTKKRVAYYYDCEVGNYHYGQGHPMKPHRVRMTHNLIVNYGLYKKMTAFRMKPASAQAMMRFHGDDYIDFLRIVTPDNMHDYLRQLQRFNVGEDCPVFDGLFEFCQIYTAGSIGGAARLNNKESDIVINWAGGLHHAKKSEASGFCYINDCVLAILELLKKHQRVLYIDIDIHHGDGVEEAFYVTDRVMTVSFHKFGEYFPGTGDVSDSGAGAGKRHAVNFPLRDGMDDDAYRNIFRPVMASVMEHFAPEAIVLQCGADSLSGDRLGCFNLSVKGHGDCVRFMKTFNVPMLVIGGGGYTMRNVSRAWTYETSIVLDSPVPNAIPVNDYYPYYGPDFDLCIPASNMENLNTPEYLERVKQQLFEQLRGITPCSVQIQTGQPGTSQTPDTADLDPDGAERDARDDDDADRRESAETLGERVQADTEMYDGDGDQDNGAAGGDGGAGAGKGGEGAGGGDGDVEMGGDGPGAPDE